MIEVDPNKPFKITIATPKGDEVFECHRFTLRQYRRATTLYDSDRSGAEWIDEAVALIAEVCDRDADDLLDLLDIRQAIQLVELFQRRSHPEADDLGKSEPQH